MRGVAWLQPKHLRANLRPDPIHRPGRDAASGRDVYPARKPSRASPFAPQRAANSFSVRLNGDTPFSNRGKEYKLYSRSLRCFSFFCSTVPQAFFRPDRGSSVPPRAGAVKDGRCADPGTESAPSRPRLDSAEHGGRLHSSEPEEALCVSCCLSRSAGNASAGPSFSSRSGLRFSSAAS